MKNLQAKIISPEKLLILLVAVLALTAIGCSEKSGALKEPLPPWSYITPTVQNLKVTSTSISRCEGGILDLTCEWTSPNVVSSISAYVGFVRTIQNPKTEPVGVIASGVASLSKNLRHNLLWQTTTATTTCTASDSTAFYSKFKDPIIVPTKIGTDQTAGQWAAKIPFAHEDIASAPLGVHQMIFYMYINYQKTNTLSFEVTFVE